MYRNAIENKQLFSFSVTYFSFSVTDFIIHIYFILQVNVPKP